MTTKAAPLHKQKPRVNEVRWFLSWPACIPFVDPTPEAFDGDWQQEHAASQEEAIEVARRVMPETALGWVLMHRARFAPWRNTGRWMVGRPTICEGPNPRYDVVDIRQPLETDEPENDQ